MGFIPFLVWPSWHKWLAVALGPFDLKRYGHHICILNYIVQIEYIPGIMLMAHTLMRVLLWSRFWVILSILFTDTSLAQGQSYYWVSAKRRNSIANTLELHLSCTEPPKCNDNYLEQLHITCMYGYWMWISCLWSYLLYNTYHLLFTKHKAILWILLEFKAYIQWGNVGHLMVNGVEHSKFSKSHWFSLWVAAIAKFIYLKKMHGLNCSPNCTNKCGSLCYTIK